MINSALEDIQRTSFAYDFDYERQLIRKHQSSGDTDFAPVSFSAFPSPTHEPRSQRSRYHAKLGDIVLQGGELIKAGCVCYRV